MRPIILTLATSTALGALFSVSGALAAPVSAQRSVVVVPDANRTKAFFIKIFAGGGSFAVPTLKGLTGTITYTNASPTEKAKVYTAWGTYGSPPPPSNGGAIVAYLVVHLTTPPAFFAGGSTPKSSVSYAKLLPSKTYSFDVWDVTNTPSEIKLENVGSSSNNTLTFFSPLEGINTYVNETLCLELVQNP
jgi:hypothetical protein